MAVHGLGVEVVSDSGDDRMAEAIRRVEPLPVPVPARDRLVGLLRAQRPAGEVVEAIESDLSLLVAVMRLGNRRRFDRGRIDSVPAALQVITPGTLAALVECICVYELFGAGESGNGVPQALRRHAAAVQGAAHRIASTVGYADLDRIAVVAGLHDIGRLVMPELPGDRSGTPAERLQAERDALGTDHAQAGAALLRHWGLPDRVAGAVGRHHDSDAHEEAAIVGLADMLVHFRDGRPIDPDQILSQGGALGIDRDTLARLAFDLPTGPVARRTSLDPNPLSEREVAVLHRLSEGKVYKQIALEMDLSPSTVRSHLHRIYNRIGAADRTQAVLMATERGWL